jgi:hypothetical protein
MTENEQLRIWVNKFSYVPDNLIGMQTFSYLQDRVDYFVEPDEGGPVAYFYGITCLRARAVPLNHAQVVGATS